MSLFDQTADGYDSWCQAELGSFVDELEKNLMKEVAQPKMGEKALDLGCGTGIYSYWLNEQGLAVTGIDISSGMLNVAKSKPGAQNIEFLQGDIEHLPFKDETFDLIISNIVLEFTENPKEVIKEAMRVLKRGGRLVIGFIGRDSSWGKMYKEKGKKDSHSVFASANFFGEEDINGLYPLQPYKMKFGLNFSMSEFVDKNNAMEIEVERRQLKVHSNAGYIVARWDK
ncbi:MAG: class I SAM-dependent methyltransferase [Bacillaceae bacterium]|nr:class I SAM-dependent methyltransferase [Bacillaceae bacterium]